MQSSLKVDEFLCNLCYHWFDAFVYRCERAMLLLLHETSQGTFSHVFDLDSTELDEKDKDIPVNSSGMNINILGPFKYLLFN